MSDAAGREGGIQVLSPLVAEQIAAGEVVDRPASIVKELLENASDAGCSRVEVRYDRGGRLEVCDDGCGIAADQLPLAVRRHATSKLRQLDDLDDIRSYGFRGEALAAVGAVARLRVASRAEGQPQCHAISCDGGDPGEAAPLDSLDLFRDGKEGHGTRVQVEELFFNTPARANFLRSPSAEERRVQQAVARFAVTAPALEVAYWRDGIELWRESPCTGQDALLQRVGRILGSRDKAGWVRLDAEATDMALEGWLCAADVAAGGAAAGGRGGSLLVVNDRLVSSAPFAAAVRAGYEGLPLGARKPPYALWLRLPGKDVDVNVHPQKLEVRFRFDRALFGFVRSAVRQALVAAPPPRSAPKGRAQPAPGIPVGALPSAPSPRPGQVPPGGPSADAQKGALAQRLPPPGSRKGVPAQRPPPPSSRKGPAAGGGGPQGETWRLFADELPADAGLLRDQAAQLPDGRILGMLQDTFLLLEVPAGLALVDVHAAHERILYARMREEWDGGNLSSQTLAHPMKLALPQAELDALAAAPDLAALLEDAGFSCRPGPPGSLEVLSTPAGLGASWSERMVRAVLAAAGQGGGLESARAALSEQVHEYLADRACRAAFRSGDKIGAEEQRRFLRDMVAAEASDYRNRGRPAWNLIPMSSLDRLCLRGQ